MGTISSAHSALNLFSIFEGRILVADRYREPLWD